MDLGPCDAVAQAVKRRPPENRDIVGGIPDAGGESESYGTFWPFKNRPNPPPLVEFVRRIVKAYHFYPEASASTCDCGHTWCKASQLERAVAVAYVRARRGDAP